MAYLIYDINKVTPDQFELYFFDSNCWIIALKLSYYSKEHDYELNYSNFFDAVIAMASITEPKALKKIKHKPSICFTSLLLSELINAYMRQVAMKMYFGGDETYKSYNFKNDYRSNVSSDYNTQLKKLIDDINAYKDYTIVVDDDFINIDPYSFISQLSDSCDFNDLYYYYRLRSLNACVVTNDADFIFQDIPIITGNPKLLKLSSI